MRSPLSLRRRVWRPVFVSYRSARLFRFDRKAGDCAAIARDFPELEPRLPPVRKIWISEDARMNIFDAVALGMTFFHTKKKRAA